MGLRGLPHYIAESCEGVFKKSRLRKTRLIIDGNNFLRTFILSLRWEDDCMLGYGCNYDTYYSALGKLFEKLKICEIESVMVFVGTTGCQEAIFERVKQRNQDKIDRLEEFINNAFDCSNRILPHALLAKTTLVRFLNNFRIHHLTMDFEEDNQMAALANRWRCPIMTSDSDFYLLQYEEGAYVIPMWRFDYGWEVQEDVEGRYVVTSSYETRRLTEYHGLDQSWMALFAAVQLETDDNDNFMAHLPLQPEERDQQFQTLLRKLLQLSRTKSLDEVLEEADEHFFEEPDDDRLQKIKDIFAQHAPQDAKKEYYSFLEEGEPFHSSEIMTKNGKTLPLWFVRAFRGSEISRYLAGVLSVRATSLYTQLEDLNSPSPNVCATELRQILWGSLLKYDDDVNGIVTSFYREYKSIVEAVESPLLSVRGVEVPSLVEIPEMTYDERVGRLLGWVGVERWRLEPLPPSVWFLILVTRYWVRGCEPATPFIQAIILCYIRLGLSASKSSTNSPNSDEDDLAEAFSTLSMNGKKWDADTSAISAARDKLSTNRIGFKIPAFKNTSNRMKIHHKFAEWKTIYSEVYRLNEILQKPFLEIGPEQCFKGTFLYSLHWYFSNPNSGEKGEKKIAKVLGPLYKAVYLPLMKAVM